MIINSTAVFNPFNNSFVYLCNSADGTLWVRSSAGKWAKIVPPLGTDSIIKDFENYFISNPEVTLDDVKTDNKGDIIVPVKSTTDIKP